MPLKKAPPTSDINMFKNTSQTRWQLFNGVKIHIHKTLNKNDTTEIQKTNLFIFINAHL